MKKVTPKKESVAKTDTRTNDADVKRYLGALAEHFSGQVSAVAEQFGSLHEKLENVQDHMKDGFNQVNEKIDTHTEMIGSIMEDVAIIKSDVEILKSGMRKRVEYQDFEALERRVRLVEAKIRK